MIRSWFVSKNGCIQSGEVAAFHASLGSKLTVGQVSWCVAQLHKRAAKGYIKHLDMNVYQAYKAAKNA
jgi:hypothetical protein